MKSIAKLTPSQIQSMQEYLQGNPSASKGKNKKVKLFYNLITPKVIYVQYSSYGVEPDGSISSEISLKCIQQNGDLSDCAENFDNMKQRLTFEADLIEVDLDANGKIVFLWN